MNDFKQKAYWQLTRTNFNADSGMTSLKDTHQAIVPVYLHDILDLLYQMNNELKLMSEHLKQTKKISSGVQID